MKKTAFKKCAGNVIAELLVPSQAKRSSATSNKCRCSEAETVAIYLENGVPATAKTASGRYDPSFVYTIGKTSKVGNFDENRWNECATGIHFFMSFEEARDYE